MSVRGQIRRGVALAVLMLLVGACASPEAQRARGGDRGADTNNRDAVVEMHEGSVIYYNTPCATSLPECTGPRPLGTARQTSRS
jgi:hypothetical protein